MFYIKSSSSNWVKTRQIHADIRDRHHKKLMFSDSTGLAGHNGRDQEEDGEVVDGDGAGRGEDKQVRRDSHSSIKVSICNVEG